MFFNISSWTPLDYFLLIPTFLKVFWQKLYSCSNVQLNLYRVLNRGQGLFNLFLLMPSDTAFAWSTWNYWLSWNISLRFLDLFCRNAIYMVISEPDFIHVDDSCPCNLHLSLLSYRLFLLSLILAPIQTILDLSCLLTHLQVHLVWLSYPNFNKYPLFFIMVVNENIRCHWVMEKHL